MWKILNRLFGWDYIYWENSSDSGIARLYKDGCGETYYWRYKLSGILGKIRNPECVTWLTCSPSKWM